jgi:hypothetical protein
MPEEGMLNANDFSDRLSVFLYSRQIEATENSPLNPKSNADPTVAAQLDVMRALCLKNNIRIVEEYIDDVVPTSNSCLLRIQELLVDRLTNGKKIDAIMVFSYRHVFTNIFDFAYYCRGGQTPVPIISITEDFGPRPFGEFMMAFYEAVCDVESHIRRTIARRQRHARLSKSRNITNSGGE